MSFVDTDVGDVVPAKPPPIESTPFKLVETVQDLKAPPLSMLHSADEFAVDLEHNQYRTFQGLTCLMQISTRTEDFIVDTLKLHSSIGPYLREVFKDLSNRKQTKPIESGSPRIYAREDTHYLLYIYDLMRIELFSMLNEPESVDAPLVEVYKCSYKVCMRLYEKELLTEKSFLRIYGLQGAGFTAQQLVIVSGLFKWRDFVARVKDDSTGYVLPNKSILEIAKQMPVTANNLRLLVNSRHPYVEHNLDSLVDIIRHSIQNTSAFEEIAQLLKTGHDVATIAQQLTRHPAQEHNRHPIRIGSQVMEVLPLLLKKARAIRIA
ncbi:hypothetical protein JHK87_012070 [Glycine soja]|nr:hypothetical protein JHK87_012070 [Glycine soja]